MKTTAPQVSRMPGHLIRRLHQQATLVFQKRIGALGHDLTSVQYAALDALADNPGVDQATLAMLIAKDRATVGAVLDRLEAKDLIARSVRDTDKRARRLNLSEQGLALLNALRPTVEAAQREILPGLTAAEYDQFVTLAAKAASVTANLADRGAPGRR